MEEKKKAIFRALKKLEKETAKIDSDLKALGEEEDRETTLDIIYLIWELIEKYKT